MTKWKIAKVISIGVIIVSASVASFGFGLFIEGGKAVN